MVEHDPELFTRKRFCAVHGIGPTSFHREVNAGRLVAVKLHGKAMVHREDAQAWRDALPRVNPNRAQ